MASTKVVVTLLLLIAIVVDSARILAVFPTPSLSHQVVFRPITQELAKRGHEVVIITTDPAFSKENTPANITEIDVKAISYEKWKKMLLHVFDNIKDVNSQLKAIYDAVARVFEVQMQEDEVKDIIHKKRGEFDLLLTEACVRPALAFSHVFKVPLIQISSFGAVAFNDEIIGSPTHPLLYPIPWHKKFYNLSIWEKASNLWTHWEFKSYYNKLEEEEDKILKKVFKNIPPLSVLKNNIAMLFLNVHPMWIDNQPAPTNLVFIGGIHRPVKKMMPKDLQLYLDSSKNGVIYVSFGSNVVPSALPSEPIRILLTVLSQLPYDILLKWDKDTLPISSQNIRIAKWLPQTDLLRHPNIKLFITQGGLQSTDEAIEAAVPLIGIPIFSDQWYNAEKYVRHKIGMKLDFESLCEEDIKIAVDTVITNESYRWNIARLRALMQDQPQSPLDRGIWWIEHVIRHGADHLRPSSANMSPKQYFELDLIAIILSLFISVLFGLALALYITWTRFYVRKFVSLKLKKS